MRRVLSAREAYREWAETFDQGTPILALEARALAPFLRDLDGQRVVDIGCGTGRWLEWLIAQGARVAGADFSLEMLEKAAKKPQVHGKITQSDALFPPFRDACADLVLSALVIGHLRPISAAMDALARLVKPGGRVVLSDFHPEALRRGWKRTFRSGADTIELESDFYPTEELRHPDLELEHFEEVPFGDEERHFFEAAGKAAWFDQNRDQPAILIASYRRRA